ncbi:high mobility group box domain-containing protein, partial [Daedaleopsis nitida]
PRPKNAFILFRSDKCRELKDLEHDHRMISKIIGQMWRNAPKDERAYYDAQAQEEKRRHLELHPNYRF